MCVTALGSEIIIIVIICVMFWAVDKKYAYRLGFIYFVSGMAVQTLKVTCRIPRPWVRNPSLTPVEEAVDGATGYSFPSGHTQNASALYGQAAWMAKRKWVKTVFVAVILAVMFSRMYLGVHTPADVCAAFAITIGVLVAVNILVEKKIIYRFRRETCFCAALVLCAALLILGIYLVWSGTADTENAADFFKACGAAIGFCTGWYLESTQLDFDERAGSLWAQILKCVIGLALALAIKEGFKLLIGTSLAADFARYAILVFFVIYIYPFIFSKTIKRDKNA